jgi:hypothetical protein
VANTANFNRSPYFDDFDPSKNFYRVLLKAGHPVQARELNQLQSILWNQQFIFANNIFKNGTRVEGGTPKFNTLSWVRLNKGAKIDWFNKEIPCIAVGMGDGTGNGSNLKARVIDAIEETTEHPATLFVVYENVAVDGETTSFLWGEKLVILSGQDRTTELTQANNRPNVRCPSCEASKTIGNNTFNISNQIQNDVFGTDSNIRPTGNTAKQLVVAEGKWYHNGIFIDCPQKSIIYSKYGEKFTGKIGFDVVEEIVTVNEDPTLADNALGYPNEKAPGADRYKVWLNLLIKTADPADGDRFIIICTFENGEVTSLVEDTQYSKIMDIMAQRTYEESGNYTVKDFTLKYIDHKAPFKDDAQGVSPDGDDNLVRAFVSDGIGYVSGYRHEKKYQTVFDVRKARDTVTTETASIFFDEPAYVDLVVVHGSNAWANNSNNDQNIFTNEEIQLKDGDTTSGSAAGNVVGKMKVWDAQFLRMDGSDPVYRYYIAEITMNEGKSFSDIKSATNIATNFIAKVPSTGFFVFNNSKTDLFWVVSVPFVKSLRDIDNANKGSMIINRRHKFVGTVGSGGTPNEVAFQVAEVASIDVSTAVLSVKEGGIWKRVDPTGKVSVSGKSVIVKDASLAGKEVMLVCTFQSINVKEKTKTLKSDVTKTFKRADTNDFKDPMKLGKADILKLKSIKSKDGQKDLTAFFTLDNGHRPYAYLEGRVLLHGGTIDASIDEIVVTFDYLEHSDSETAGFFTIDSYKTILDDKNDYNYANIGTAQSSDGTTYSVSQIIDFRPLILDGTVTSSVMPAVKTTAIHDATYYVGRRDYVYIDKDGNIGEQYGVPTDKPNLPAVREDCMNLYEVYFPPYTYSAADIKIKRIENKRYTMRDIGKLEQRIGTLEYYTTLTMAETALHNEKFLDGNGLEKFKNGFAIDSFVNYTIADTSNPEYRALNNARYRYLVPNVTSFNRPLELDNSASTNIKVRAKVLTLPYTHEKVDEQPYASKHTSINEAFLYRRKGSLTLVPNHNTWSDTTIEPKLTWDIDTGTEAAKGLASHINRVQKEFNQYQLLNRSTTKPVSEIQYNSKSRVESETATSTSSSTNRTYEGTVRNPPIPNPRSVPYYKYKEETTTEEKKTTTTYRITETKASINSKESKIGEKKTTYSTEFLQDAKPLPYMKETKIQFYAAGMMPNCKLYLFFDDVNVTEFATSYFGTSNQAYILSNEKGVAAGTIEIPKGRFLNGTKYLKITNDKTNSGDVNMEQCYATAQFYAGGLDLQKRQLELNITSPTYSETDENPTEDPAPASTSKEIIHQHTETTKRATTFRNTYAPDPIAQSFTAARNQFVTKINLYFQNKDADETKQIFVDIRPLVNGYPSSDTILARKYIAIENIEVSEDASVATEIEFDAPVYVEGNKEYAFCIGGDSPDTRVFVSKLGGKALNYQNQEITTQPSVGVRFVSQNGTTWNAIQEEDIKYDLFVANFSENEGTAKFIVKKDYYEYEYAGHEAIYECEKGKTEIRIHTPSGHGFIPDDYVMINMMEGSVVRATLMGSTVPKFGDARVLFKDTSNNTIGSGRIAVANPIKGTSDYELTLKDCEGFLYNGDRIEVQGGPKERADLLASIYDKRPIPEQLILAATLQVKEGLPERGADNFNGIPYHELSNMEGHKVIAVEDAETFIIKVTSPATKTGRFQHNRTYIKMNLMYTFANLSASALAYDGQTEWKMIPTTHWMKQYQAAVPKQNYSNFDAVTIALHENVELQYPAKMYTRLNGVKYAAGASPLTYEYKFKTAKGNKYVAPMLNLDSLSVTCMGNRVSHMTADDFFNLNKAERYYPETHKQYGSELYKYVSKTVSLDNPATDLKIWFDVNKPLWSEFAVYVKVAQAAGAELDAKEWTLLTGYKNQSVTHNTTDEYAEVVINVNETLRAMGQPELGTFAAFKVKLVGMSYNPCFYPRFKTLRMVALT